jgi:protein gp37
VGTKTTIAWTTHTWNPWHGCARVSAGCDHCYMFEAKRRYGQDPEIIRRGAPHTFTLPLTWRDGMVFTCSWSDFFIRDADPWRAEAWDIIRRTPHLTYQILTKRPARMRRRLPWTDAPWAHVWLGVSVEAQAWRYRLDGLRAVPAALRFVSFEPLLEDLGPLDLSGIGWVIVGGESGPRFRSCEVAWIGGVVEQCRAQGVPCFVKQDAGPRPGRQGRIPAELWVHDSPRSDR